MKLFLSLMPIIWWSMTLLAFPVFGQVTVGTECGAAGTGYVPNHAGRPTLQARTAEQAVGTRVAADGWWTLCDAAPAPKVPVPCPGIGEPRTWSIGGLTCTSAMKGGTLATDPSRDRGIADGDAAMWRQWTGAHRGHLIERCVSGQRVEVGKTCAAATHCDASWALIRDNRTYVYNAAARPVPIGGRVDAKSTDGKAIGLWCGPGAKFSIVR
jgi:hypothetical protein